LAITKESRKWARLFSRESSKKTQPKILENHQPKNQRTPKKREKDLLVYWFLVQRLTLNNQ